MKPLLKDLHLDANIQQIQFHDMKPIAHRGGDTSMAGMAIAIPGVLNISETGDTMGKIR